MKIIGVDNFNRDTESDILVAENVPEFYANLIADLLNGRLGDHASYFYKVVANDHKLYKWELQT